ncbi:TPA: hypothetical protein ACGQVP_005272, partial [Raoultella planticola]
REVAYITLSSFRVNPEFQNFFSADPAYSVNSFTCAVSVGAHYRDPILLHKSFIDLFFQVMFFRPFRGVIVQIAQFSPQ